MQIGTGAVRPEALPGRNDRFSPTVKPAGPVARGTPLPTTTGGHHPETVRNRRHGRRSHGPRQSRFRPKRGLHPRHDRTRRRTIGRHVRQPYLSASLQGLFITFNRKYRFSRKYPERKPGNSASARRNPHDHSVTLSTGHRTVWCGSERGSIKERKPMCNG